MKYILTQEELDALKSGRDDKLESYSALWSEYQSRKLKSLVSCFRNAFSGYRDGYITHDPVAEAWAMHERDFKIPEPKWEDVEK